MMASLLVTDMMQEATEVCYGVQELSSATSQNFLLTLYKHLHLLYNPVQ